MRVILLVSCLFILNARNALAQASRDFRTEASAWETVVSKGASPHEIELAFARVSQTWQSLPQNHKQVEWPRLASIYVERSQATLEQGDAPSAARSLRAAGELNRQFGGRIEYATKSPRAFFEKLAVLQTGIAAATGTDPLAGLVDYFFRKEGDKYFVARQEPHPEVAQITINGVADSEALAQVHELSVRGGRIVLEKTRWVIGPKGRVEDTVRQATREVTFEEDGRLLAKSISAPILNGAEEGRDAAPKQLSAVPVTTTPVPSTPAPVTRAISPLPTPTVAQTPAQSPEGKRARWPWVVGIRALIVIVAVALKRRA